MNEKQTPMENYFYRASAADFKKIPGSPIAYWVGDKIRSVFINSTPLDSISDIKQGLATCNNDLFIRLWFEVSGHKVGFGIKSSEDALESQKKWFPYNKGGGYRKWYGNNEYLVNWKGNGFDIHQYSKLPLDYSGAPVRAKRFYFREGITYGLISSFGFSARRVFGGFIFDVGGSMIFPEIDIKKLQGFLCSKLTKIFITILNPTLNYQVGDIQKLPILGSAFDKVSFEWKKIIDLAKYDWNSYETSWDFTSLPLLSPDYRQPTLKATYQKLRTHWQEMTLEMQRLEQENNRIFIDAYGLQDELTPEVPLKEITLTCNPYYRYNKKQTTEHTEYTEVLLVGFLSSVYSVCSVVEKNDSSVVKKSFPIDKELEALLLADTMRELVSYAVGCMFGRYALEKPGLILANQGETTEEFYRKIGTTEHTEHTEKEENINNPSVSSVYSVVKTEDFRKNTETTEHTEYTEKEENINNPSAYSVVKNSFPPNEDNVIPILDGDWFTDDISERFKQFLKVAFGADHYEANLRFVEESLNIKGKRNYSIRDYFLGEFYSDHVRRYKKRPIYWLFSSPKGSFNALIYMHRYRPDTVSVVLNDYLREFRAKLTSHKNHLEAVSISASASQGEKTKALKEIEKVTKMIAELEEYEREVLYPLATEQVEIDLDDGVKVNYPKLGTALKMIPGLEAKEE